MLLYTIQKLFQRVLSANHKILTFLKSLHTICIQTLPGHTNILLGIVHKTLKFLVWRAADLESYLYVKNTAKYKPFQVRCTAKPKISKFFVPCKLYAADAIQIPFQVKCIPQGNDKSLAVEHKTWKVICIGKSPGTTDEHLILPSPLHAIPKTSKLLARFQAKCA